MQRLVLSLPNATLSASADAQLIEQGDNYAIIDASRVALLHGMESGQYYRSGHNSWSPSGWNSLSDAPLRVPSDERRTTADDPGADDIVRHHGSWMGAVVEEEGGAGFLIGALAGGHPKVRADEDVFVGFDEIRPARWFVSWGSEAEIFEAYVEQLRSRRRSPGQAPRVWCSWYSYYENVSWDVLAGQLPGLAKLGFTALQIDDGWQLNVGDWRPNAKFGHDLAACASYISDLGVTPGLWIAPFIAREGTPFLQAHPEAFVHGEDGKLAIAGYNWGGPYYALDTTHPLAQEYLRDTIGYLLDAGIRYIKTDFINAAAIEGVRFDREASPDDAFILGSQILREAAGEDTYLLGSGALIIPAIGLYDGIRVGCDVAPIWKNYATGDRSDAEARNAFMGSVSRLWLRELIDVDPDVIFFRHMKNLLNDQQIGWLQDVAAVAGFKSSSDPLVWLTEQEQAELSQWLARHEDVQQISRNVWSLDGREVDFGPGLAEPEHCYPVS